MYKSVEIIRSPWINKFKELVMATRNDFIFYLTLDGGHVLIADKQ